jgi:hypothetical protein
MKDNYPAGVNLPCTLCTPRSDAKTKRSIRHAEYNHSLVFWSILCYATEVRFEHMVPVQKWHLPIWLDPHLKSVVHTSVTHTPNPGVLPFRAISSVPRLPNTNMHSLCTLRTWPVRLNSKYAIGTFRSSRICRGRCRERRDWAVRLKWRASSSLRRRNIPGLGAGGRCTVLHQRRGAGGGFYRDNWRVL